MAYIDIINRWPSLGEFASDIGTSYTTAHAWRRRGSIPIKWHRAVADAAAKRRYAGITVNNLARIARDKESE